MGRRKRKRAAGNPRPSPPVAKEVAAPSPLPPNKWLLAIAALAEAAWIACLLVLAVLE